MKLTTQQIEILINGKIEENRFYLQGQLDRKQYTDINQVLETIGLKWNRGKKAHIVEGLNESELKEAINDICETGEVETLKETIKRFQFYPTPKEVAEYLVELAEIKEDDLILEPSAGLGNIIESIIKKDFGALFGVELDTEKYKELIKKYTNSLFMFSNNDFLLFNTELKFNKIIANPPFSKSQDVKHILHMYELLEKGGRIVSIASSSIQTREGKLYDELRALNPEFIELPEGSFKESGTLVNTVIVLINK